MFRIKIKANVLSVALFCLLSSGFELQATQISSHLKFDTLPKEAPKIVDLGQELAPLAFVKFCLQGGALCEQADTDKPLELTAERWQQIQDVNQRINSRIKPDPTKGPYDWSLETSSGNCNDYAVQKQNALVELGFPLAALALTVAITPWGEGHLVLTLRTDRGDFVLDNLREEVLAWNRIQYRWIKRQSAQNPQQWVGIAPANQQVASLTQNEQKFEQNRKSRKTAKKTPFSERMLARTQDKFKQQDKSTDFPKTEENVMDLRLVYFSDGKKGEKDDSVIIEKSEFDSHDNSNKIMFPDARLRL